MLLFLYTLLFMLPQHVAASENDSHWVGTWATAPQLVETHNNPPSPGLKGNELRQIFQISIGGDTVRLKLSNEFSTSATEIVGVEMAYASTAGSQSTIDESSKVSLTFDGSTSITIAAGQKATSDPIAFHLDPRQNVAVTIKYGEASSSNVTGHPGSRTTSYLKSASTSSFAQATKTEHWYTILALEVKAPATSGCVAILGNSITDGRGSTTNQQNRWPDVLSRRLLANTTTAQVGVLNMGIGGNCMLNGGLGPTGSNRWQRDLLEQEGVKWIILFEAVNDLGSASNGEQTAQRIINVYKQIIQAAHQKNIYVFGATITPFKGNSYYSTDHEKGRHTINTWMRTTPMLDGLIDFDKAVRNPYDTLALQDQYLFENDHLHLNASGYEAMGNAIDLRLFTKTDPVAADEDTPNQESKDAVWIEAERLATSTCGYNFSNISDVQASGGHCLKSVKNITNAAPSDSADMLVARFEIETPGNYHIYGRVNCPTWDDDSYWIKIDQGDFPFVNGLCNNGSWGWVELGSYQLSKGSHTLTIGCREDGALLDKLCITTDSNLPSGLGAEDNYSQTDTPDDPNIDENTFSSNLPLIYIYTDATINSDKKVAGTMKIIDNPEGKRNYETDTIFDYNGSIGIKLRGNSSLSFAQKKYTLETWDEEGNDIKKSLLGLPAESDWVLLAPYNDLSLVRDVFAYNMWTEMGHWGPRSRMCEVFINNEYLGIYVFCEKIKRDKNRVDIANLKHEDTADRELTGGYIVRVDAFDENDVTFKSKVAGIQAGMWGGYGSGAITWTIFYPKKEDLQEEQKTYIQNFVDQMEQSFQQTNFKDSIEGYAKWINVPSFVDYFIHTELSLNADGYKRSSYFFKDKDANDGTLTRMEAGPVWDYNLAYGDCNFCNANNPQAWVYEGCETNPTPAMWKKLTQDPAFMAKVKTRYAQLRNTIISRQNINAFFDDYADLLDEAKDRHYEKYDDLFQSGKSGGWSWWGGTSSPISYFAAYYVESYEEEIQTVKEWFAKRLAFLDSKWDYDESLSIKAIADDSYFDIKIVRDNEELSIYSDRELTSIEVYSLTGHLLKSVSKNSLGTNMTLPLLRSEHSQPVIIICQAKDNSYISRKVR
jgi:lysophospholipase L1-like esterase